MVRDAPIRISTRDGEVTATLLRLCARLQIPATSASAEEATWAELREESGALVLYAGIAQPVAHFPLPVQVHALGLALQQSWATQQQQVTLALGEALRLETTRRQIVEKASGAVLCDLTEKETELLAHLVRAGRAGEDKDILLRDVWGYHPDVETRTVDSHLYRLRQKLADLPSSVEIISVQGRYYLKC
jgi:DNA-binding response OmpR family regulator